MPPHEINYRANIWALRDAGVQTIIATAAVAGLIGRCTIGDIIIPDQLIDYTYGRENTFLGPEVPVKHVDFAQPYSESLRQKIITKAKLLQFPLIPQATYGITQGPRLETLAELKRYAQDTCDFVGMTGMPEAALARELELDYACIALVVREGGKPYESKDPDRLQINDERIEKLIEAIIRSAQP
jgi:purine nucleoside phosphorylase